MLSPLFDDAEHIIYNTQHLMRLQAYMFQRLTITLETYCLQTASLPRSIRCLGKSFCILCHITSWLSSHRECCLLVR